MFARNVYFRVKSLDMTAEFDRIFQTEILPVLRQQEGFRGELTLSNPGSLEQIAISLWDSKDYADAYDSNVYPQVLRILARVTDGRPKIRIYAGVNLSVNPPAWSEDR